MCCALGLFLTSPARCRFRSSDPLGMISSPTRTVVRATFGAANIGVEGKFHRQHNYRRCESKTLSGSAEVAMIILIMIPAQTFHSEIGFGIMRRLFLSRLQRAICEVGDELRQRNVHCNLNFFHEQFLQLKFIMKSTTLFS